MSNQSAALLEASIKQHCKVLRMPAVASQFVSLAEQPAQKAGSAILIKRLFRPPSVGFLVTCPDCGAPHAAPPGMEELILFVCAHRGSSVELMLTKIQ